MPLSLKLGRLDTTMPKLTTHNSREIFDLLFDEEYYLGQLDGVVPASPKEHYLDEGWRNGFAPHPLFSPPFYLKQRGEMRADEPLVDYLRHGSELALDPHPLFCAEYYCAQAGIRAETTNPLLHYYNEGWRHKFVTHRMIDLPYSISQLPRAVVGRVDPLWYIARNGLKFHLRFHPMFNPKRLLISLRIAGELATRHRRAEEFVDWNRLFSPSILFDPDFYLHQYPEAGSDAADAWRHFCEIGQFGDFDPNPYFDSKYYRSRYRKSLRDAVPFMHYMTHEYTLRFNPSATFDLRHYARNNSGPHKSRISLLEHFLDDGRFCNVEIQPFRIPDFLQKHLQEATVLEPDVKPKERKLAAIPVYNRHCTKAVAFQFEILRQHIGTGFEAIVFVPHLQRGGADLAATNLVRWLHQKHGANKVLLVVTDSNKIISADWLPPDTRMIVISHLDPVPKARERELILQYLIEEFRPEHCYNVNSKAAWSLFGAKGRALSQITKLYAEVFCFDYDLNGRPVGYALDSLPQALQFLTAVYMDSAQFRRILCELLNLTSRDREKLKVLRQPCKKIGYRVSDRFPDRMEIRSGKSALQIFWAGRIDRQKRPDIMLEIARRCPQHQFHVFGSNVLGQEDLLGTDVPANVATYGEYQEFFKLPLQRADLFIYTSAWDGLPFVLLDIVQSGIPVIAPDIGGVSELVDNTTGWLIPEFDDHGAYVAAIDAIANSTGEVKRRVEAGLSRLESQHSWSSFAAALESDRHSDPVISEKIELIETNSVNPPIDSIVAVLNLHREGELARPSFQSAIAAVQSARSAGLDASLSVIVDRPDSDTLTLIKELESEESFRVELVDYGDLAHSRNHAIRGSTAEFVGFLDGDDLWSSNWLTACHAFCRRNGPRTICHPKWNLIFGADEQHFIHPDQTDRNFSLTSLRTDNYWTALSFAHRDIYGAIPYQPNRILEGFGFEDWNWNCETIEHGFVHRVVPETTHFIRYKEKDSLRMQTHSNSCLKSTSSLFVVEANAI